MMNEFIQWIEESKVPQMDASTAATIDNLRRQAAKRRWGRIKNKIRVMGAFRRSLLGSATGGLMAGSMTGSMTQDPNTAQMVHHLKRQIARYRWQRAISKVMIALKLSHPRQPRWDPSATSEGVNNGNAFVDMKRVTDQACENKQKFFRGGSVMNNLIESGIEVVWFSDLTQNDVVYGEQAVVTCRTRSFLFNAARRTLTMSWAPFSSRHLLSTRREARHRCLPRQRQLAQLAHQPQVRDQRAAQPCRGEVPALDGDG